MKRYILPIILIFIAVGFLLISSNNQRPSETIPIGTILHLTGDQAEPAQAFLEGMELALDEEKQFKLIIEDDNLQPPKAQGAAKKLIETDSVQAIVLASFLEAMAAGPEFERAKIPAITLWDSAKDIEDLGDYIFGMGIWTPSDGEVSAEFAKTKLNASSVFVVNTQNEYSTAVTNFFIEKFKSLGGTAVGHEQVSPQEQNFQTLITKIKSANPDAIYSPITDNVIPFYKQLKELGWGRPIVTSAIITDQHIQTEPNVFEGIYQSQAQDPENPVITELAKRYEEKYKKPLKHKLFVGWGYDAIKLFADAFEKTDGTSEAVKNYLYTVKNYQGASGTISFDPAGSSRTLSSMYQIKNETFELVQ